MSAKEREAQIRRMGQYVGRCVTVKLRGSDVSRNAPDVTVSGTVLCLAVRESGRSAWRGAQVDMIVRPSEGAPRVFSINRIVGIEVCA